MPIPQYNNQLPLVSLEQAISDFIESIALMQTGLAGILNLEGSILKHTKQTECDIDELTALNRSVGEVTGSVIKLQTLLQFQLLTAKDLLQETGGFEEE